MKIKEKCLKGYFDFEKEILQYFKIKSPTNHQDLKL